MSVDKAHRATILDRPTPKEMFNVFDKKYSATNAARLHLFFRECQAIRTQKQVLVIEKYMSMLNFNAKICVQKPELAFWNKHLINFLPANILST